MALWDKISSRGHVEDRRGISSGVGAISITGLAILMLANYLLGGNPLDALNQIQTIPQENQVIEDSQYEGEDEYEVFASTVLGSNNAMWSEVFANEGKTYNPPKLVLFRQATISACGNATSQVGPHYCPFDETIYLDETFFDELKTRFGARGGDVAEAYVISHEVGHHVQNELNILQKGSGSNEDSIKIELQADCFSGMWANSVQELGVLEPGEIKEAMDAAAAVGDDRIQERATGYVNPENWTHGSSEQRVSWFNRGFNAGSISSCDTFSSS